MYCLNNYPHFPISCRGDVKHYIPYIMGTVYVDLFIVFVNGSFINFCFCFFYKGIIKILNVMGIEMGFH